MLVNGKEENSMERALISVLRDRKKLGFGKMEKK